MNPITDAFSIKYMKILINENFLFENRLDFLKTKYSKIDPKIFNDIVEADPTHNKKYTQWLLQIYTDGKLALEDLYKASEYLEIYNRIIPKLNGNEKNIYHTINKNLSIGSLQQLFTIIEPYKDRGDHLTHNEKLVDNLIADTKQWKIYVPQTYEASCQLGSGTQWCTATGKTREYYDKYTKDSKLYILINKENSKKKYQFSFDDGQFMDSDDSPMDVCMFLLMYPDVLDVFLKLESDGIEYEFKVNFESVIHKIQQKFDNTNKGDQIQDTFYKLMKTYGKTTTNSTHGGIFVILPTEIARWDISTAIVHFIASKNKRWSLLVDFIKEYPEELKGLVSMKERNFSGHYLAVIEFMYDGSNEINYIIDKKYSFLFRKLDNGKMGRVDISIFIDGDVYNETEVDDEVNIQILNILKKDKELFNLFSHKFAEYL